MRVLLSIAVIAWGCSTSVLAQAESIWGVGVGKESCETWLTAHTPLDVVSGSWVLGFWSGLNAEAQTAELRTDGRPLDNLAIVDLVKAECHIHPGESLWAATTRARDQEAFYTR